MNKKLHYYFQSIKFCIVALVTFSFFACGFVSEIVDAVEAHSHESSHDNDSQESKIIKDYKQKDETWLSTHLFAGNIDRKGYKDGTGAGALFSSPLGITSDSDGNFYIADSGNHVIRKVNSEGDVSTWAGVPNTKGFRDGSRYQALFNNPTNILMVNDIMYVLDTDNHKIRKIVHGIVSTVMGGEKGYIDNVHGKKDVQFERPQGFSARTWSDKSIKPDDPHKKYGEHTDITIYDGPNAKRWRMIVLKDGELRSIETVEKNIRFNGLQYRKNAIFLVVKNAYLILDPTRHALFKIDIDKY